MQSAGTPHSPRPPLANDAALLRQVLAAAGFSDKKLIEKFGAISLPTPRTHNLPRLLRETSGGVPIDTLSRLFLFGIPVPASAARAALAPFPLEALGDMGLLEARGPDVAATAILYPYGPYLFLFDRPEKVLAGAPRDLVMGITSSTTDLGNFTVRRPARSVLDLGCGSGFHALLASEHSKRICGVDVSPRAVAFARLGAALSGVSNVEFLTGDRYEPVRGERFDLIVGNLPFVIGPAGRYYYRDGGMPLDAFTQSVLRAAPGYLEEGGFCQVICDWAHLAGCDWQQRISGWFEGSGCDVWVLRLSTANPVLYAEAWIRETEADDPQNFARLFEEWTACYDSNGVQAISTGLIAVRRRSGGRNWFHTDEWPEHVPEGFGKHVALRFALYDFLEKVTDDEDLLATPFTLSPAVRLVATNEWSPSGWRIAEARLCLDKLPGDAANINSHVGHLLAFCNGTRSLREAVAGLAAALRVEPEHVAAASLPLVRSLVEHGFLLPPGLQEEEHASHS